MSSRESDVLILNVLGKDGLDGDLRFSVRIWREPLDPEALVSAADSSDAICP